MNARRPCPICDRNDSERELIEAAMIRGVRASRIMQRFIVMPSDIKRHRQYHLTAEQQQQRIEYRLGAQLRSIDRKLDEVRRHLDSRAAE